MEAESMSDTKAPDCMTCWRKNICPQAEAGKFCTLYQTKEPKPQGENINDLWNRGEDVTGL
jgi:hypothetical protein